MMFGVQYLLKLGIFDCDFFFVNHPPHPSPALTLLNLRLCSFFSFVHDADHPSSARQQSRCNDELRKLSSTWRWWWWLAACAEGTKSGTFRVSSNVDDKRQAGIEENRLSCTRVAVVFCTCEVALHKEALNEIQLGEFFPSKTADIRIFEISTTAVIVRLVISLQLSYSLFLLWYPTIEIA